MTDQMTAEMLRRWARQCAAAANDVRVTGDERDRLLKMHASLLEMASQQDWLEGVPSSPGALDGGTRAGPRVSAS